MGFTLIELLICISVLSLILLFGVPLGYSFYQRNQLNVIVGEIKNAIQYARNMALLKGLPVTLAPLPGANDWSCGMILFADNKAHHYDEHNDKIIHQWQWHSQRIQVIWHGFRSQNYLIFSSNLKQSTSNGSFLISNYYSGQESSQKIIVNRLGHVRDV